MKSKVGIIILIMLLTIITICLILFLVLCLNGNFAHIKFGGFGKLNKNIIYNETYLAEGIKNIDVVSEASNIEIKTSENNDIKIVVYGEDDDNVEVTNIDGNLKINYPMKKRIMFGFNVEASEIVIYVPKDYSEEMNIKNDYGNCKIADFEKATMNIEDSCGNIKIGKTKNIKVKADYGNVDIETVLNKCELELSCGNLKIDKLEIKENSSIKNDYGNIKIKEKNDIYIDAEVDLGNKKINGNNRHAEITLKIDASCGNVKVGE